MLQKSSIQMSEKQKVLEKNKKVLLKEVLGKNKSQNKVNSKLNLVSEIGKEKVMYTGKSVIKT